MRIQQYPISKERLTMCLEGNNLPVSKSRDDFLKAAEEMHSSMIKLLTKWEDLSSTDSIIVADSYPFKGSFDEVAADVSFWIERLYYNFDPKNHFFYPTVKVGELKEILNKLPDDTQIVVEKKDGFDWLNIQNLELPDNESMFTLTIHTSDSFSPVQLGI